MKFTVAEQGDFEVYPAGIYPAELESYQDAGMGDYGKLRVRLNWTLYDDDGAAFEGTLPSWVSQVISSRSTLYGVVCALLGVDALEEGQEIEMEDLVGKRCQLTVTVMQRKDGPGERNNVAAYSPIKRRTAPPRRAPIAAGVGAVEPPF